MKIGIICGYGLFDKSIRSTLEYEGLCSYYNEVINFCNTHNEIGTIVVTGGYTNLEKSDLSESYSVLYLVKYDKKVLFETTSQKTIENLAFAWLTARKSLGSDYELTIFCDSVRKNRVQVLSNYLFEGICKTEVISFDRYDIHPNSTEEKQNSALNEDLNSEKIKILRNYIIINQ